MTAVEEMKKILRQGLIAWDVSDLDFAEALMALAYRIDAIEKSQLRSAINSGTTERKIDQ